MYTVYTHDIIYLDTQQCERTYAKYASRASFACGRRTAFAVLRFISIIISSISIIIRIVMMMIIMIAVTIKGEWLEDSWISEGLTQAES